MEEIGNSIIEFVKTISFVIMAVIAGLAAHILKKVRSKQKIKFWETLSIVIIAGIIGYASFYHNTEHVK